MAQESIYAILFEIIYFGVHSVSWNQASPFLVRVLSLEDPQLATFKRVYFLIIIPTYNVVSKLFSRRYLPIEVQKSLEVASAPSMGSGYHSLFIFVLARIYILWRGPLVFEHYL